MRGSPDAIQDDFGDWLFLSGERKVIEGRLHEIARHFIDKLLETDLHKAITSDIISMSHKLGHSTIAEGVEHDIQLQYLKDHDCDKIQGYLISKPLDENVALDLLGKGTFQCLD